MFETYRRPKDPGESVDYAHLFQVAQDDPIVSATVETVDSSSTPVANDLTVGTPRFAVWNAMLTSDVWAVQVRLSGGGAASEYFIRYVATTSNGQRFEKTVRLAVLER